MIIIFQKVFAETKAQTTAIDLELRRIEAKEAALHVQYLSSFMPDGFMKRGGMYSDYDYLFYQPKPNNVFKFR